MLNLTQQALLNVRLLNVQFPSLMHTTLSSITVKLHFLVLVSGCEVSRNSGLLWAPMTPLLPDVKAAVIGGSFIRHISEF